MVERLTQVRSALLRELSGNATRLRFINTRLILTVGVDLNEIHPSTDDDPQTVGVAVDALRKMGFLKAAREGARG